MKKKVLIVEDQFVEANDLQLMLIKAGYQVTGIARSVQVAREMIEKERPELVLLDIFLKGKLTGIDLARQLKEDNIAFIYLSANSNEEILAEAKTTEPYGFIVKPFREKDLLVTLEIAQYRHEHSRESRNWRETQVTKQFDEIPTLGSRSEILSEVGKILQQEIPFDYFSVDLHDRFNIENTIHGFLRIGFDEYQNLGVEELATITRRSKEELIQYVSAPGVEPSASFYNNNEFQDLAQRSQIKRLARDSFQMKSLLFFPVQNEDGLIMNFCFYSRSPETYNADHLSLLYRFQKPIVNVVGRKPGYPRSDSKSENAARGESAVAALNFEGMVGKSHLLLKVFDQISQVAPFDTSVLILGESGTGKERIVDCIHSISSRSRSPLVKVNCAALPASLIESELFGHEKGAFTGAVAKRTGRFEQAHGGTIFLDEIGEMPIDLQVKLLRVLQEKEIHPIGSRSVVKIDVRVIAATNRNLEKEVGEGRFRLDLYYRLNVFPIVVPPLRERLEDIPVLAEYFIKIYNRKSGKSIVGLSDKVLRNIVTYSWPGNIRELENLIERGILLAKGTVIDDIGLPTANVSALQNNLTTQSKTIHENERDYIISILEKCKGRVWGHGGAADVLGVPPSTLKSKMKKLGIHKENYE